MNWILLLADLDGTRLQSWYLLHWLTSCSLDEELQVSGLGNDMTRLLYLQGELEIAKIFNLMT